MRGPFAIASLCFMVAAPALAEERRFSVDGFDEVLLSGSMDVVVTTGSGPSVVAEGSATALDRLDIRTEGNRLIVGYKRGNWSSWGGESPTVRVSLPKLSAATISGSGDLSVNRIDSPSFRGVISGSGDMRLGALTAASVDLAISGSGDMTASGRCTDLKARISGSGDMGFDGLVCETVDIAINGSGNVAVRATKTGALATNGSGDIRVTGGARCTVRKSGSGEIRCG